MTFECYGGPWDGRFLALVEGALEVRVVMLPVDEGYIYWTKPVDPHETIVATIVGVYRGQGRLLIWEPPRKTK